VSEILRQAFVDLREKIMELIPDSSDRSIALINLETARMWTIKSTIPKLTPLIWSCCGCDPNRKIKKSWVASSRTGHKYEIIQWEHFDVLTLTACPELGIMKQMTCMRRETLMDYCERNERRLLDEEKPHSNDYT